MMAAGFVDQIEEDILHGAAAGFVGFEENYVVRGRESLPAGIFDRKFF